VKSATVKNRRHYTEHARRNGKQQTMGGGKMQVINRLLQTANRPRYRCWQ